MRSSKQETDVPSRMYVLEISGVEDLLVQVAASSQVQKLKPEQIMKTAELEASTALHIRYRVSFVRSDGVEPAALAGHTSPMVGQMLAQQVSQRKLKRTHHQQPTRGGQQPVAPVLGALSVSTGKTATAPAPLVYFFHAGSAGHEQLLLIEVLAEADSLVAATYGAVQKDPAGQVAPGTQARQWRVAQQQDLLEAGATTVRRATGAIPPSAPRGGRGRGTGQQTPRGRRKPTPPPLVHVPPVDPDLSTPGGAEVEASERGMGVVIGWVCVGFHMVTDVQRSQVRLHAGSLRERLHHRTGFEVENFMRAVQPSKAGMLSFALHRVPPKEVAFRLLPPLFPAALATPRLGGITTCEVLEGNLFLQAAAPCEATVRRVLVNLPDENWLEDFQLSLSPADNVTGDVWPADLERPRGNLSLYINVGSHNGLRWLNSSMKAARQSLQPDAGQFETPTRQMTEDVLGHAWRIDLLPGDSKALWRADVDIPIDFICDKDCAVVVELMAAVDFPPIVMGPPKMRVDPSEALSEADRRPEGPWQQQVRTIGCAFVLPYWDAIEQVTRPGLVSNELTFSRIAFQSGPGVSFAGRPLWFWDPVAVPRRADRQLPVQVSLSILGDALTEWLQKEHADQAPLSPLLMPPSGVLVSPPGSPVQAAPQLAPGSPVQQSPLNQQADLARQDLAQAEAARIAAAQQAQVAAANVAAAAQAAAMQQAAAAAQGIVHQPQSPAAAVAAAGFYGLPPEVERIYLRDQGTQSDFAPIPGAEDDLISGGRPLTAAAVEAMMPLGDPSKSAYAGPTIQPLSQADRAQLVALLGDTGAGRLLQGLPPAAADAGFRRRDISSRLEEEDPMQADDVSVEFLTFRGISGAPVAERIHFQLRFFLFPPLRTAPAFITGGPGEPCLLRSSVTNERLALVYHVDGSAHGNARDVHLQLVQYLASRNAVIEVWNSNAVMQIGFVQVALEPLIRQGKPVTKLEIERPVLDPVSGEVRGFLKLLLMCRARQPGALSPRTGGGFGSGPHPPGRPRSRARHKARALVDLNAPASPQRAAMMGPGIDPTRQMTLEKQDRLRQLQQLRGNPASQDLYSEKAALLAEAEDRRQARKVEEVARRLDRYNTTEIKVEAPFATPTFFHVEFANPYGSQALFTVTIVETTSGAEAPIVDSLVPPERPVHGILQSAPSAAVTLIRDPAQWRQLVEWRKLPPPARAEYELFTAQGQFLLRANDSVFLPFRYLAFDHGSMAPLMAPVDASGVGLADIFAASAERDRRFVIKVCAHQGQVLRRFEVFARSRPCIIHRALRFFESEGSPIEKTLALPPRQRGQRQGDQADGRPGDGDRFVYCTDGDVHLIWRSEDELTLRLKAPASLGVRSFFVMCYADPHFLRLTAVQSVEVHGLKSEQVRVCVGQYADKTICLPPAEVLDATAVRVYSSDPETVVVQQTPIVDPRFGAKFSVVVAPVRVGVRLCRLHAVDPATQRRITALLLIVAADLPEVKRAHEITLPLNSAVRKRLRYENDTSRPLRFMVRSSDPSLVTVQTPEMVIPALDSRFIDLVCHACPGTTSYRADIFLFVASEDREHQETRLLQLTYT